MGRNCTGHDRIGQDRTVHDGIEQTKMVRDVYLQVGNMFSNVVYFRVRVLRVTAIVPVSDTAKALPMLSIETPVMHSSCSPIELIK